MKFRQIIGGGAPVEEKSEPVPATVIEEGSQTADVASSYD